MLNIEEINNTIEALENSPTTFDNCMKLSSLYICRDNYNKSLESAGNDDTNKELNDILPQYRRYVNIKRRYQLGEVAEIAVQNSIKNLCLEIAEFLHTLYSSTDMETERTQIKLMLDEIVSSI